VIESLFLPSVIPLTTTRVYQQINMLIWKTSSGGSCVNGLSNRTRRAMTSPKLLSIDVDLEYVF